MPTKSSYREYFRTVQDYVKITKILSERGESLSNYSKFMKGPEYDFFLSIDKLYSIESAIKQTLNTLV